MRVITAMSASVNSLHSSSDTCSCSSNVCLVFLFSLQLFPFGILRVYAPRDLGLPGILSLQHQLEVFHVHMERVGNLAVASVSVLSEKSLKAISDRCDQICIQPCAVSTCIEARTD